MIRALLAATALATPAGAQVVTSPSRIVDSNGDGLIKLDKMAATVVPPLKKGAVVIECDRVRFIYAVKGTPCPVPEVPMTVINSSPVKIGSVPITKASNTIVTGALRAIETDTKGTYENITIDNLKLLNIQREGIRLRGKVSNFVLRNFRIEKSPTPNYSPNLPEGIHVEKGDGLLFEDGYILGMQMYRKDKEHPKGQSYPNGDGIAIEKGVTNVVIRRVVSENHSDSAFDLLKGSNIVLDDVTGRNAARCVKTGAVNVVVTKITCVGVGTAIELHGNDITIDTLVYDPGGRTSKSWLFSTEAGSAGSATLTVKRCVGLDGGPIRLPSKDSIWLGQGKNVTVNLGPGCRK